MPLPRTLRHSFFPVCKRVSKSSDRVRENRRVMVNTGPTVCCLLDVGRLIKSLCHPPVIGLWHERAPVPSAEKSVQSNRAGGRHSETGSSQTSKNPDALWRMENVLPLLLRLERTLAAAARKRVQ